MEFQNIETTLLEASPSSAHRCVHSLLFSKVSIHLHIMHVGGIALNQIERRIGTARKSRSYGYRDT